MSGIYTGIYNTFFRSSSVAMITIFSSAFAFQIAFDKGTNAIWDSLNKSRQWKDIKHKYMETQKEEDDDE